MQLESHVTYSWTGYLRLSWSEEQTMGEEHRKDMHYRYGSDSLSSRSINCSSIQCVTIAPA